MLASSSGISTTAAFAILGGIVVWTKLFTYRFASKVQKFRDDNHGYTTSPPPPPPASPIVKDDKPEVLLIVNPSSGGGKGMEIYQCTLYELEQQQGLRVEVYVTSSSEDLIHVSTVKDLSLYSKMIAIISGDSSIYEFVQGPLQTNKGKWPYAPILPLPGGSGNVLSTEFHGFNTTISKIIQDATTIKYGSVLKFSSQESTENNASTCSAHNIAMMTTRYAVHNAFDGMQRLMVDTIETYRSSLYPAFGMMGVVVGCIASILLMAPFRRTATFLKPAVMTIMLTDIEAKHTNLGFGVTTFDDSMIVVYTSQQHSRLWIWTPMVLLGSLMNGKMGESYHKQGGRKKPKRDEVVTIQVVKHFTLMGDGHYRIYADGSKNLPIEGARIVFQVIPHAIPYYVIDDC